MIRSTATPSFFFKGSLPVHRLWDSPAAMQGNKSARFVKDQHPDDPGCVSVR